MRTAYIQANLVPSYETTFFRSIFRARERARERKRYKHRLMFMKDFSSRFIFGSSSRIRSGIQGGSGVWRKLNEPAKITQNGFFENHDVHEEHEVEIIVYFNLLRVLRELRGEDKSAEFLPGLRFAPPGMTPIVVRRGNQPSV